MSAENLITKCTFQTLTGSFGHLTKDGIISLSPFSLANDVADATLGACGLWLGTATLAKSFFGHSPWLHGQQDSLMTLTNTIY